jgi:hypothetical protein
VGQFARISLSAPPIPLVGRKPRDRCDLQGLTGRAAIRVPAAVDRDTTAGCWLTADARNFLTRVTLQPEKVALFAAFHGFTLAAATL